MRTTVRAFTLVLATCGGLVLPISAATAGSPAASAALPTSSSAVSSSAVSSAVSVRVAQASAETALLRVGDRGPQVATWQARVNGLVAVGFVAGPRLAEDGVFGPRTRTATRAVQARLGLAQDAVVGPLTRAAVAQAEAQAGIGPGAGSGPVESGERVLAAGMRGQDVRDWQRTVNIAVRLGQLDHPRLAEDGVFGPQTRRATLALQDVVQVATDGRVGPRTRLAVGWLLEGIPG